jgi:hypothetical protein
MADVADEITHLRSYPTRVSPSFKEQLDRANAAKAPLAGQSPSTSHPKGFDRSDDLAPVARPAIVRTLDR